jgi:hypothetical protein
MTSYRRGRDGLELAGFADTAAVEPVPAEVTREPSKGECADDEDC